MPTNRTPNVVCVRCGKQFYRSPSRMSRTNFCLWSCLARIPSQEELEAKFWSLVEKQSPEECWEWQGTIDGAGYPMFHTSRHHQPPAQAGHRYSYELAYGPIPNGLFVCHRCDNRRCVNPAHLFLGTPADNVHDMLQKGRGVKGKTCGTACGHAKLTEEDVLQIRADHATGQYSQRTLAKKYGVSRSSISYIVRRIYWPHI